MTVAAPARRLDTAAVAIFVTHLWYLLPFYYLLNALILAERRAAELTLRTCILQSQIFAVAAELAWSALHPRSLPPRACAACAVAYACLQGALLFLAFEAPDEAFSARLVLPAQAAAALATVPLQQLGYSYTLQRRISPMRYRILAWLVAVVLAVAALLRPAMASPLFAIPSVVLPGIVLAALLLRHAGADDGSGLDVHAKTRLGAGGAAGGGAVVGAGSAALFLSLGCATGTLGESITDMATSLAVRASLQEGRQDLALANQVAVFVSMVMAYWSETRPGGGAGQRAGLFILVWAGCQAFRCCAVHLLAGGRAGVPLLMAFVFMDKYTGPLGAAALDVALLEVLRRGEGGGAVRSSLLWTARMAVSRLERPLCQLVLLHTEGFPIQAVSAAFTAVTCAGVLASLRGAGGGPPQGAAKKAE